ncbi:MAG: Rpn family recombination-promoting nuclease/putative transposase [Paludibacteraceae bacterium]|nr:Rpn family recombination-promoting nuclease/putative transposase [Paludibacteraceae bacterium]
MEKEERTEMLNPFCDEGFKRIFGDKILLMDFLNSFVDAGSPIVDLTYENKEMVSVESDGRTIIFDLLCKLDNGMNVIIEMQNKNQDFFVDRAVFYLSRAISMQGEKGGKWKYGINSVIGIFITQFRVFDSEDVLSEMKLIDPKTNKTASDKIHGYFIQLPKFKKSNNGCVDHFEEWIYNLKNMERMGNIEFKNQEVFERLWNLSNCSMLSIEERRKYERSLKAYRDYVNQLDFAKAEGRAEGIAEGRAEGIAEGRAEGRAEERALMISTLRKNGMSDDKIAFYLDIDIEEVKSV